jgi:hypothetical protein
VYAGHAAIAMAAKGLRPRIPIAVLVPAAFAPDWIQWVLHAAGNENRLLSHSIVSIGIVATVVALVYWAVTRQAGDAAVVWLTYVSHWPADFITGIKPTWPGGPELGLELYAHTRVDVVLECVVVALCWLVYRASLPPKARRSSVAFVLPIGLIAMQLAFAAIQEPEVKGALREAVGN